MFQYFIVITYIQIMVENLQKMPFIKNIFTKISLYFEDSLYKIMQNSTRY